MSASLHVFLSVSAKTPAELSKRMLEIQAREGGKVAVLNVIYNPDTKEYVCFYYPLRSLGGGVM